MRLLPRLDFGGVESRVVTLSKLIDRSRFDFRACTIGSGGATLAKVREAGTTTYELGQATNPRNLRAYWALLAHLRSHPVDIVHSSIAEANLRAAVARLCGVVPRLIVEEVGTPKRSALGRRLSGLAARSADLVVGVSQETCEYLSREEGVPASKVRFINNTVDPLFFELSMSERAGCSLLAVGRLVPEKDHLTLLRAMSLAIKTVPQLTLTIVGEGPLRATLETALDELRLREHVTLAGYKGDVPALLQGADAFVMPSVTEGTSIALAEAMAAGIPIVASRVRGILAVMGEYDPRWLIPAGEVARWADALIAFSGTAPEQRRQLGSSARAIAGRRVSVQAYKASLEAVYADLAASLSRE